MNLASSLLATIFTLPKAWDITIEGISYVKNYRTDFGAEIDQKGIDAVIERLETQNATGKPDAPGTTPTAKAGR